MQSKLEWALWLAGLGFPVFPIRANSKVPKVAGWQEWATRDVDVICRHWTLNPDDNIGCACGVGDDPISVVDLDVKNGKDGIEAFALLEASFATTAVMTYRLRTPSGGEHRLYRGILPNTVERLGPGIDTRGKGGYIVGPGSSIDGKFYTVIE